MRRSLRPARPFSAHGRAVVITGASTGLGRECALHLDRIGFHVFAGVRRSSDGDALVAASSSGRLRAIHLDVTCEDSVRRALAVVSDDVGDTGLWGLVNNAGICVSSPLECVTPARLREQLDTNVVGAVAVTQAFLTLARRARGRIVNVSSGVGRVASPYLGAYAASQFAKEGLSDALRRELRPFGVAVCVIQPGAIMTPLWGKISETGETILDETPDDVADLYRGSFRRFLATNENRARSSATRAEDVAEAVADALTAKRPKARYRVGRDARAASLFARLLPDAVLDAYFAPLAR